MSRVAILDYGAGNIFSLKNSLERAGATVDVIDRLDRADHSGLLLPGVGNFDPAMRSIGGSGLPDVPVLGICLGMEMFFDRSEEGTERGLGVVPGYVALLPGTLKVPHMGWNSLEIRTPGRLLDGVQSGSWAYFVHSYRVVPRSREVVTADSDYGEPLPAVIEHGNLFGTQFHPEKSGDTGRAILYNFLRECAR